MIQHLYWSQHQELNKRGNYYGLIPSAASVWHGANDVIVFPPVKSTDLTSICYLDLFGYRGHAPGSEFHRYVPAVVLQRKANFFIRRSSAVGVGHAGG